MGRGWVWGQRHTGRVKSPHPRGESVLVAIDGWQCDCLNNQQSENSNISRLLSILLE